MAATIVHVHNGAVYHRDSNGLLRTGYPPPIVGIVELSGEITPDSQAAFVRRLDALGGVDEIELAIDSEGGDQAAQWFAMSALARTRAKLTTRCVGLAGSAAAALFCMGDVRVMADGAALMVHFSRGSHAPGSPTARDDERYRDYIAERTRQPSACIERWMRAETWFSAEEAVRYGFAHAVEGTAKYRRDWTNKNRPS